MLVVFMFDIKIGTAIEWSVLLKMDFIPAMLSFSKFQYCQKKRWKCIKFTLFSFPGMVYEVGVLEDQKFLVIN